MFEATSEADGNNDALYQKQVTQLFGQVGGIVFLTLVVNGTLAGPLLKKLGLTKSPDARVRLMKQLDKHFDKNHLDEFVKLLADPRFQGVSLPVIQDHIPFLKNITVSELKAACLRNPKYTPNLQGILPYLDTDGQDMSWANTEPSETRCPLPALLNTTAGKSSADKDEKEDIIQLRHFFLEVLNTIYNAQLEDGELDGRNGFVSYSLLQSIDFASSDVAKGLSLDDWKTAHVVDTHFSKRWVEGCSKIWEDTVNKKYCCMKYSSNRVGDDRAHTLEYKKLKNNVLRSISFLEAHRQARKIFTQQLSDSSEVDANEQTVLDESTAESEEAQKELDSVNSQDLLIIQSHYFCSVLLNKSAKTAESLLEKGVLEEKEASSMLDEIDTCLLSVNYCSLLDHGEDDAKGASKQVLDSIQSEKDSNTTGPASEQPVAEVDSDAEMGDGSGRSGGGVDRSFHA